MEALILFALVLGLLFIGLPVGIALGLSSILFITFFFQRFALLNCDFALWCGYTLHTASDSILHPGIGIYVDRWGREALD